LLINNNITIHKQGHTNVVRKILWFAGGLQENFRTYFLESPVFLPGESGISSWRVRYFFLESPVFLPGESWPVKGALERRVAALGLDSSFECGELPRKDHSANFALTEF
jgi:hypothetical protein